MSEKSRDNMSTHGYTVVYELAEDGGYYAHIPAL